MEELVVDHLEQDTNWMDEKQKTKQHKCFLEVIKGLDLNVPNCYASYEEVFEKNNDLKNQLPQECRLLTQQWLLFLFSLGVHIVTAVDIGKNIH